VRPHRAYVPRIADELWIEGREARHLLHVLRARSGDRLILFDGTGQEARARVVQVENGRLRVQIEERYPVRREPDAEVTLYLALLKGEKLFEVVRMGTELGVTRFVLTITRRTVARSIGQQKRERLRRIAIEAAKQSGRTALPAVEGPVDLSSMPPVEQGLVADPNAGARVPEVLDPTRSVALAVGPEGGLTEDEVTFLISLGFTPVTLGRRILRAETAACALVALVTAGYGQ